MPYNIGGYQKIHWDRGGFEVNTTQNPYYLSLNIVTKILYYTQLMFSLVFGKMWIDTSSQNTYIIHKLLCKYTFNTSYTRPLPRLRAWFENSESWHCHISMLDVAPFCVFSSFSIFFFFLQNQVAPIPWAPEQLFLLLPPLLSLFSISFLPLILERDFDPTHLNSKQWNWQKWESEVAGKKLLQL